MTYNEKIAIRWAEQSDKSNTQLFFAFCHDEKGNVSAYWDHEISGKQLADNLRQIAYMIENQTFKIHKDPNRNDK